MSDTLTGIVPALDESTYHSHPALSSTGARKLLDSPARFAYWRANAQPHKDAFDLGTAVHTKVLGVGSKVLTYPEEHLTPGGNVSTKAATVAWADEQRAQGLILISPNDASRVDAMTEAVLAHPEARRLFEQDGTSEASVFATDASSGVDMRARFDFLPSFDQSDPWAVDLKTTSKAADAETFSRTVANFGYYIQQEWYLSAYGIATGDPTMRMKFVVVETEAPHLVAVHSLADEFAQMGTKKVREALDLYAACATNNLWPGYPEADPIQPPSWLMFLEGDIE